MECVDDYIPREEDIIIPDFIEIKRTYDNDKSKNDTNNCTNHFERHTKSKVDDRADEIVEILSNIQNRLNEFDERLDCLEENLVHVVRSARDEVICEIPSS